MILTTEGVITSTLPINYTNNNKSCTVPDWIHKSFCKQNNSKYNHSFQVEKHDTYTQIGI